MRTSRNAFSVLFWQDNGLWCYTIDERGIAFEYNGNFSTKEEAMRDCLKKIAEILEGDGE